MGSKITLACLFILAFNIEMSVAFHSHMLRSLGKLVDKAISTCDEDQDCANSGVAGSLVPDPENCHNYYVCITVDGDIVASDSPVTCPEGEYFNSTDSTCEPEVEPCTNACTVRCSLACNGDFDPIPYPRNCSVYQVCLIDGSTDLEACPSDSPYFNGDTCTKNPSLCCDFCSINCTEVGVEIPDPCDCRKYYICEQLGIPSETDHKTCSLGQIFDPASGSCVSGSDCEAVCSSCSNTQSTTPIITSRTSPVTTSTTPRITSTSKPTTTFFTTTRIPLTSAPPTSTAIQTTKPTSTNTPSTSTANSLSTRPPCLIAMMCVETGNFARCPYCESTYFRCTEVDQLASYETCPDGEVFNPNPDYPFCLDPSICPYP